MLNSGINFQETNENGFFEFKNLPKGEYNLTVFAEGFTTVYQTISIINNENQTFSIRLVSLNIDLKTVDIKYLANKRIKLV